MILIELRFALTVPSLPSPKNTARTVPSDSVRKSVSTGKLRCVTSSTIPTVKCVGGSGSIRASKTAFAIAGVNSFDDRP